MSERIKNIAAGVTLVFSLIFIAAVLMAEPSPEQRRVDALASTLACPVCNGESIADSPSQISRDLYDLIEEQVAAGLSDQEIRDSFVASYGPGVLLDPPASTATLWLWALPVGAFVVGVVIVVARVRSTTPPPLDEDDRRRVSEALDRRRDSS